MRATMSINSTVAGNVLEELRHVTGTRKARPMFEGLALYGQSTVQKEFESGSLGGRSGGWAKPIPWWAVVIRANVGKGKGSIKTKDEAASWPAEPLKNKGALMRSWAVARNRNITNKSAEVGTHMPYADIHQEGGSQTFKFDADKLKRFQHNVAMRLPGRKPRRTPTGRKSRAKRNWNPEYFKMLAILKMMDGKNIKIRKRPMVPTDWPNTTDRERIGKIITLHLEQLVKGAASGGV